MDVELGRVEYSEINSPGITEYYNYWKQKCSGQQFPSNKDIGINDIPKATPNIYFVEIHYLPLRLYFTFVGSAVIENERDDFSESWLHELEEWEWIDNLIEMNSVRLLIRQRVPIFGKDELYWQKDFTAIAQWGVFPLSDDNKTITHYVSYTDYSQRD